MKKNNTELSNEEFHKKFDHYTKNLERSDVVPLRSDLEENGYKHVEHFNNQDRQYERSFSVYEKEGVLIVTFSVYIDREGGMNMTQAYASPEEVREWEADNIENSLNNPNEYLIESILFRRGIKSPENELDFSDQSGSYNSHHYKWIIEDKELAKKAIQNFIMNHQDEQLWGRKKIIYEKAKILNEKLS